LTRLASNRPAVLIAGAWVSMRSGADCVLVGMWPPLLAEINNS